jgi:hypothetical protein
MDTQAHRGYGIRPQGAVHHPHHEIEVNPMSNDMKDMKELKEVMSVISETVPDLLEKITKVLYDAQEGEKMGRAVAAFYSALVESGMSNEQAYALTKEYMSSMSLGSMISGLARSHDSDSDDIGEAVKERIKREIINEMDKD